MLVVVFVFGVVMVVLEVGVLVHGVPVRVLMGVRLGLVAAGE